MGGGKPDMTDHVRDKRSPKPTSEAISKTMRGNKGKDTKPELLLRKALRKAGYPGYRLHWKKAPGRPDICCRSQRSSGNRGRAQAWAEITAVSGRAKRALLWANGQAAP